MPDGRRWIRALVAVGVIATLAMLVACSGGGANQSADIDLPLNTPPAAGDLDFITWNLPYGEPASLDPITLSSFSDAMVLSNTCDSLARESPDGRVTPNIASSIEQTSPTTVMITVSENRRFWDGTPVTAEDVQFSLDRIINDARSLQSSTWGNADRVVQTGPRTVEVIMKKPDTYLATQLHNVTSVVVSKKFALAAGEAYGTPSGGIMCSGPFKMTKWLPGQSITLTRNDDYGDDSLRPKVKTVELSFITDANTLTLALKSGQIDGSYGVPISGIDVLRQATAQGKLYFGPSPNVFNLMMNTRNGRWGDPRVRKALKLAIPYQEIAKALYHGAAQPARSSLAPMGWPANVADQFQAAWDGIPEPQQDLEKARRLLQDAGANGTKLRIFSVSDQLEWKNVVNAVADGATQAGFNVEVTGKPNSVVQVDVYDPAAIANYDVITNEWNADYRDPRVLFNAMRLPRWSQITTEDPQFNTLMDEAIAAQSPQERTRLELAVQKRASELDDWIPVAYIYNRLWMNNRITGAPAAWAWWCYPYLATVGAP
jgi:peptide/nickel transport system substrate-binding protein